MTKSEGTENRIIAQRYAQALLDFAGKDFTKEEIFSEISDVLSSVESSDDLKKVISSPVVQSDEKKNILRKIFSKNNKIILNFLNLLIDKNRFSILHEIVTEYKTELNRINKLVVIEITSAIDLKESEKAMVKVKIEKILKRDIELKWAVDSNIIGGLIFKIDDSVIDCSIQHTLEEIKRKVAL